MTARGYVPVSRAVVNSSVYNAKHFFYYFDLLQRAAFRTCQIVFRGQRLSLQRGQYVTTYDSLSWAWRKSKSWVHRSLDRLQRAGLITLEPVRSAGGEGTPKGTQCGTLITMLEYDSGGRFYTDESCDRNDSRNRTGDIEEEVNNEEAAAAASSLREEGTGGYGPRAGEPGFEPPKWCRDVLEAEACAAGRTGQWPANEVEQFVSLVRREGIAPAFIHAKVVSIATRRAKKKQPPVVSLNYYIAAILQDFSGERAAPQGGPPVPSNTSFPAAQRPVVPAAEPDGDCTRDGAMEGIAGVLKRVWGPVPSRPGTKRGRGPG